MAKEFIDVEIQTDPQTLAEIAYDKIQTTRPDWVPHEAALSTAVIGGCAEIAAELRDIAAQVPRAIFRYFGAKIIKVPPIDAAPASVDSTWTMKDNAGYTIDEGTEVTVAATGDVAIGFKVTGAVVVPPGSAVTAVGEVGLVAVITGADGTGLSGTAKLATAADWVTSIALVGSTVGGVDAETDDDYLDRLARTLETLGPHVVVAADVVVVATAIPGIARVLVLDNYDPGTNTYGNEKETTVVPIDAAGANAPAPIKTTLQATLASYRETGFIFNVIDPTRTTIDVTYTAKALPGFESAAATADVLSALTAYLNPATWGREAGDESFPSWSDTATTVRVLKLAQIIEDVDSIDYLESVTIAIHSGAAGTPDIVLPGPAPLPAIGTVTPTIHLP